MHPVADQKNPYIPPADDKELVILIVEDDKGNSLLMTECLERAGLLNKIILFENGKEALNFLNGSIKSGDISKTTYVLILDHHMPKVNGIEVLTFIRQHSCLRDLPVIVNSSCDDQEIMRVCYSLGCIDYIVKPIKVADIIFTLKRIGLTFSMS